MESVRRRFSAIFALRRSVGTWKAKRYRKMTEFYRDVAEFKNNQQSINGLPLFSFIEPSYCQPGANDAHPPHDMLAADALVASVYNAVRSNKDLWSQTLLVIAFDEHGGFLTMSRLRRPCRLTCIMRSTASINSECVYPWSWSHPWLKLAYSRT